MQLIRERLNSNGPILADGAMGTMIQKLSLTEYSCTAELNIINPDLVSEISKQYLLAGAEILQTNTFGASPIFLDEYNLAHKSTEIIKKAVDICKKVAGEKAWVMGIIGPCGKRLKPSGDLNIEELEKSLDLQAEIFVEKEVDVINIESVMDIKEAIIASKAIRKYSKVIPICISATFNQTKNGYRTFCGSSIEEFVDKMENESADVIGANCCNGIKQMLLISEQILSLTKLTVMAKANAGLPEFQIGKAVYKESPEFFAQKTSELIKMGVKIVGGCCGTTPEYIKKIKDQINSQN